MPDFGDNHYNNWPLTPWLSSKVTYQHRARGEPRYIWPLCSAHVIPRVYLNLKLATAAHELSVICLAWSGPSDLIMYFLSLIFLSPNLEQSCSMTWRPEACHVTANDTLHTSHHGALCMVYIISSFSVTLIWWTELPLPLVQWTKFKRRTTQTSYGLLVVCNCNCLHFNVQWMSLCCHPCPAVC